MPPSERLRERRASFGASSRHKDKSNFQPKAEELKGLLASEALLESLPAVRSNSQAILGSYRTLYESRHSDRTEQFRVAIEKIKGREEWTAVPESMQEPVLGPLQSRCCESLRFVDGAVTCESCHAGLSQMDSDVAAIGGLFAQVIAQIQKLVTPPDVPLHRVRVAEFFAGALEDEDQIRMAVGLLQDHLLKLLGEGVKIVVE